MKVADLIGRKFGKLKIVSFEGRDKRGNALLYCKCECGKKTTVRMDRITSGETKSCGCLHIGRQKRHGESKTRLYRIWTGIKCRCHNNKHKSWSSYGGRGITLYKKWNDSYEEFRDWAIAHGYNDNLTIERIDVNGNYHPNNCCWITIKEQNNNRRPLKCKYKDGERFNIAHAARENGLNKNTVYRRLYRLGWSLEKALKVTTNLQ